MKKWRYWIKNKDGDFGAKGFAHPAQLAERFVEPPVGTRLPYNPPPKGGHWEPSIRYEPGVEIWVEDNGYGCWKATTELSRAPKAPRNSGRGEAFLLRALIMVGLGFLVYFTLPFLIFFAIGFGLYLVWAWGWAVLGAATDRR